jgi:hypothetical protein
MDDMVLTPKVSSEAEPKISIKNMLSWFPKLAKPVLALCQNA